MSREPTEAEADKVSVMLNDIGIERADQDFSARVHLTQLLMERNDLAVFARQFEDLACADLGNTGKRDCTDVRCSPCQARRALAALGGSNE